MKHKQRQMGAICCFALFIVVCLFLAAHMKGAFRAAGYPEIGLLFFVFPDVVASFSSHHREVLKPLFGTMLAAPCSMLIMRLFFSSTRSFWRELAWLLNAVFWCALGTLRFLFISSLFKPQHRKNQQSPQHEGLSGDQASRFSFTHAAKSV